VQKIVLETKVAKKACAPRRW